MAILTLRDVVLATQEEIDSMVSGVFISEIDRASMEGISCAIRGHFDGSPAPLLATNAAVQAAVLTAKAQSRLHIGSYSPFSYIHPEQGELDVSFDSSARVTYRIWDAHRDDDNIDGNYSSGAILDLFGGRLGARSTTDLFWVGTRHGYELELNDVTKSSRVAFCDSKTRWGLPSDARYIEDLCAERNLFRDGPINMVLPLFNGQAYVAVPNVDEIIIRKTILSSGADSRVLHYTAEGCEIKPVHTRSRFLLNDVY